MTNKIKNRGFTLVETLIAVFILATSIAAPLTIASRGLNNALIAKDQIVAFYLAQDALEFVRFARDTNTLSGGDWITGVGGSGTVINLSPCLNANGCYFDSTLNATGPNAGVPFQCSGTTCSLPIVPTTSKFLVYSSTGFFWYGAGTKTIFVRKVNLTSITANEYTLTVNVYWNDVGSTHTDTVTENIFNWQ